MDNIHLVFCKRVIIKMSEKIDIDDNIYEELDVMDLFKLGLDLSHLTEEKETDDFDDWDYAPRLNFTHKATLVVTEKRDE